MNPGFLNLPPWRGKLRDWLRDMGLTELAQAPVLNAEDLDHGWQSLESEDFLRSVSVGFHVDGGRLPAQWPEVVITSDPQIAGKRLLSTNSLPVGVRGAIGGNHPLLDLFSRGTYQKPPQRLISISDGVVNFILAEMESRNLSLEEALQEAQWQNLAPGNPTRHLHGIFSRDRLALLASILFEAKIPASSIETEGLTRIDRRDIVISQRIGFNIRLLGVVEKHPEGLEAWVRPCLIPDRYLLSQVRGKMEAGYIQRENQLPIIFTGPGSSWEVSMQGMLRDWDSWKKQESFGYEPLHELPLLHSDDVLASYYMRISFMNSGSTISQIMNVFSENGLEIQNLIQAEDVNSVVSVDPVSELIFFSRSISGASLKKNLKIIREQVKLASVKSVYRYETSVTRRI